MTENVKKINILFIEDDEVDQLAFERLVKKNNLNFKYKIANSLKQALSDLSSDNFDVIISDYQLKDGTTADLFKESKSIPIIITTATGDEEVAVRMMKNGAYDYLIKDPDRNYLKVLPATVENALARKMSEDSLVRSEERFRKFTESTRVIPWEADPDTWNFSYVGPQAKDLLGYSPEEMCEGNFWAEHIYPNDMEKAVNYCLNQSLKGNDHEFEYRFIKKDGQIIWINELVSVIMENEKVKKLRGIMIDITERKRTEQSLQIMNSINEAINRSVNVDDIYKIIVDKLHELEIVDSVFIYLTDFEDNAVLQYHKNVPEDCLSHTKILKKPAGLTWEVISKNQLLNFNAKNTKKTKHNTIENSKFKSFIGIPVKIDKKPVGALIVTSFKEQIYDEFIEDLLESIANQLEIALKRARDFEEISRKGLYESISRNIAEVVHQTLDLDEVLDNAVAELCRSIKNIDNTGIYLVDEDKAVLKAHRRLTNNYIERAGVIQKPRGYTWKTILTGKPQYCEDTDTDDVIGQAAKDAGIKSYLSVPIIQDNVTIGCININSLVKNGFDSDELKLLENIANQIEVAVINAKIANELKSSQERYKLLYDNNPAMYFTLDENYDVLSVNKFGYRELGYNAEDLIGKSIINICYEEDIFHETDNLKNCLNTHDKLFSWEVRCKSKSGEIIWVRKFARSTELSDGESEIFLACQNITKIRNMEEEIQKVQKLDSLGVLAGGIAHDFNNMLTSILGNISLLRLENINNKVIEEKLADAEKACIRAKDLTNQLLTFSKGGLPVKKISDSLKLIVEDAASLALSGSSTSFNLKIKSEIPYVEIDEGQINQVVSNIVINAQQAMTEGGIVNIILSTEDLLFDNQFGLKEGLYVKISISDNGIGISKKNLKKIFDPYFTLKERGLGLGLSTSYSIIKSHNGHIDVISDTNKGTTFTIYLPASLKYTNKSAEPEVELNSGAGKIIVMDDDSGVRRTIQEMLKKLGYDCELAKDGNEAIELFKNYEKSSESIELVLLDLTVKRGMGGKDAAKILKQLNPEIKIIVSSGYSNDSIMSDYRRYGFDDVIKKPYSIYDLSITLDRVKNPNCVN